jgi:periplasmic protein TonB
MKPLSRFTLVFALTLFALKGSAQDVSETGRVYNVASVEVMPGFPGGLKKFFDYVSEEFTYSDRAIKAGLTGRMIVHFIVESDGSLSDVKVIRDLGYGTDKEAERVLLKSPKWNPGKQNGKPVRVLYTLPLLIDARNRVVKR